MLTCQYYTSIRWVLVGTQPCQGQLPSNFSVLLARAAFYALLCSSSTVIIHVDDLSFLMGVLRENDLDVFSAFSALESRNHFQVLYRRLSYFYFTVRYQ